MLAFKVMFKNVKNHYAGGKWIYNKTSLTCFFCKSLYILQEKYETLLKNKKYALMQLCPSPAAIIKLNLNFFVLKA